MRAEINFNLRILLTRLFFYCGKWSRKNLFISGVVMQHPSEGKVAPARADSQISADKNNWKRLSRRRSRARARAVVKRRAEKNKTTLPVKQLRILFYSAVNKYNCGRRAFTPFGKGSKVDGTRAILLLIFVSLPALSEKVAWLRANRSKATRCWPN